MDKMQGNQIDLEDAIEFSCLGYVCINDDGTITGYETGEIEFVLRLPNGVESHRIANRDYSEKFKKIFPYKPKPDECWFRCLIRRKDGSLIDSLERAKMPEEDRKKHEKILKEVMDFDMSQLKWLQAAQESPRR